MRPAKTVILSPVVPKTVILRLLLPKNLPRYAGLDCCR